MRTHALRQLPAEGRVNILFLQEQLIEDDPPASRSGLCTRETLHDLMWLTQPRRAPQEMVAQFAEERGAAEAAHMAAMRDASAVAAAAQARPPRRQYDTSGYRLKSDPEVQSFQRSRRGCAAWRRWRGMRERVPRA
jgi:hypothetical protein